MSLDEHPLDGLLLVDKPGLEPAHPGTFLHSTNADQVPPSASHDSTRLPTSHDVVQRVRRLSGQRRIGHTGTLDPMASGLLVLCLGRATRLVEYYQGHDKQYCAEITLGFATDTYDGEGQVVERKQVPPLDANTVQQVVAGFVGKMEQRPPIYSALKQGGESLHRKARRGEEVEIPTRSVTFRNIDLLEFAAPDRLAIRVVSTAGAYIRSLAVDIGHALGTVATLTALRREAAGALRVEDAHTLEEIEHCAAAGTLAELLLPAGDALDLARLDAPGMDEVRRLGHGQIVAIEATPVRNTALHTPAAHTQVGHDMLAALVDTTGALLGIVRCLQPAQPGQPALWKAEKWFAA